MRHMKTIKQRRRVKPHSVGPVVRRISCVRVAKPRCDGKINDPDHIKFVRGILAQILNDDPRRNPIFNLTVIAMLEELERMKRRDAVGSADTVVSPPNSD